MINVTHLCDIENTKTRIWALTPNICNTGEQEKNRGSNNHQQQNEMYAIWSHVCARILIRVSHTFNVIANRISHWLCVILFSNCFFPLLYHFVGFPFLFHIGMLFAFLLSWAEFAFAIHEMLGALHIDNVRNVKEWKNKRQHSKINNRIHRRWLGFEQVVDIFRRIIFIH